MDNAGIRERISNRRPHREQIPIHGREIAGILALVCLVALPIAFGLLQASEYVRTNFEIEALRRQKLAYQESYRRLRIEKATLESLDRVEAEAGKRGLVPSEPASTVLSSPSFDGRTVPAPSRAGLSPAEAGPAAGYAGTAQAARAALPVASPTARSPLALPAAARVSAGLPAERASSARYGDRSTEPGGSGLDTPHSGGMVHGR
jgi:hypothetical protein